MVKMIEDIEKYRRQWRAHVQRWAIIGYLRK
jgi:hypothetical protein